MNRLNVRNMQTLEKAPVALFLQAAIGAVGAPTLNVLHSKGILSIVRTGVGAYTINFGGPVGVDTYQYMLHASAVSVFATSTAVSMVVVADNSAVKATPGINVQFVSAPATPVELGNGENLRMKITLSNTTAI